MLALALLAVLPKATQASTGASPAPSSGLVVEEIAILGLGLDLGVAIANIQKVVL